MRVTKAPKRRVRFVIWDLDQTLYRKGAIYFKRGQRREIEALARRWGVTPREARRRLHARQRELQRRKGKKRKVTRTEAVISLGVSRRWWNEARNNCWRSKGELQPNARITAIIRELSVEFRCVVASNSTQPVAIRALQTLRLLRFFEFVWGPDTARVAKHSVAYWQRLARRLKVRPRNCLVVGDRKDADCDPAIRAGFGGAILVVGPSDLGAVRDFLLRHKKKYMVRGKER